MHHRRLVDGDAAVAVAASGVPEVGEYTAAAGNPVVSRSILGRHLVPDRGVEDLTVHDNRAVNREELEVRSRNVLQY